MRKIYTYLALSLVLLAGACTPTGIKEPEIKDDGQISILAAVGRSGLNVTKASGLEDYKGILESATIIGAGTDLKVGLMRVDQTQSDYETNAALTYLTSEVDNNVDIESYTFSNGHPHYYVTAGDLEGTPDRGYRRIQNFEHAQFYKTSTDYVNYIGWYPMGTPVSSAEKYTVSHNIDGRTDVLYSDKISGSMSVPMDTMVFHHGLCQFRVFVYRMNKVDDESELPEGIEGWGNLKDIKVKNFLKTCQYELPSTFKFDYEAAGNVETTFDLLSRLPSATLDPATKEIVQPDGANGLFYVGSQNSYSGTTLEGVELPVGLSSKQQVACFISAPPKDGFLQLDVTTSANPTYDKAITIANEFKGGYAYDIILCFSDHGLINAEVCLGKWRDDVTVSTNITATMFYDLSRYGTANCYIVSSANIGYTFNGLVKGCGNALGGGDIVGVSDCSLPDKPYIDVIYQSTPGLIELAGHSLVDGVVMFTVPGDPDNPSSFKLMKEGNVIIAARKAAGEEILWTWHIWITDRPMEKGYSNGYNMLDRNLGALEAPKTKSAINALSGAALQETYGYYYQWGRKDPMIPGVSTYKAGTTTIAQTVKDNYTFYGAGADEWHSTETGVDNNKLWGYTERSEYTKTIYDPCPPGYRVPERNAWQNILDCKQSDIPGLYSIAGSYIWYPAAGFIDASAHAAGGTLAYPTPGATQTYVYTAQPIYYFDANSSSLVNTVNASPVRADAYPVRCVSTNVDDNINNLSAAQTANSYIVSKEGYFKFKVNIRGNGTNKVAIAGAQYQVFDAATNISVNDIHHVNVLWWQGDLSGVYNNNNAGTDCPIQFYKPETNTLRSSPTVSGLTFAKNNSTDGTVAVGDATIPDENGYIYFEIPEGKFSHGNAMIAAFDAGNNVLWTWLVWLTEEPQKVHLGPRTINYGGNRTYSFYSMDRNLGSTYYPSASEFSAQRMDSDAHRLGTVGLYYQWGRKDAFTGPTSITSNTGSASSKWFYRDVNNNYAWTTKNDIFTRAAVGTRSEAIPLPMTFFTNTGFTNVTTSNWNTYSWTGSAYNQYLGQWGYSSTGTQTTYDPVMTKTINDPCPPGYYMPSHPFMTAGGFGANGDDNDGNLAETWTASTTETRGLFANSGTSVEKTTRTFIIDKPIYFPYGGYRSMTNGSFTNLGSSSYFHSGLDMAGTRVRTFRVTSNGGGQKHNGGADASNVRCRAY